ncbi:hypothetical protein MOF28_01930 [Bacillus haynesii]|uniref:hypothetical protein n=1 Tax=Bacillus haynesii TaxID=1925021 RepID=UPI00227F17D2|nr:hypothetical protein [Bacillus haynesii]MCY9337104.1 hypothetical protein [Bacillus haynesii]
MSVIDVFRKYMDEYHPHLALKDWQVDFKTLSSNQIINDEVRDNIPEEFKLDLKCWIFFYDGDTSNVVYLLQDKQGLKNIEIGLLKEW